MLFLAEGNFLNRQGRRPEGWSVASSDREGSHVPGNVADGGGCGGRVRPRGHLQTVRTPATMHACVHSTCCLHVCSVYMSDHPRNSTCELNLTPRVIHSWM